MAGPYRIVPYDGGAHRVFRLYKGDEHIGSELYLRGAKRIIEEFQKLSPAVEVEPYQRPRHTERELARRAGRWGMTSNR